MGNQNNAAKTSSINTSPQISSSKVNERNQGLKQKYKSIDLTPLIQSLNKHLKISVRSSQVQFASRQQSNSGIKQLFIFIRQVINSTIRQSISKPIQQQKIKLSEHLLFIQFKTLSYLLEKAGLQPAIHFEEQFKFWFMKLLDKLKLQFQKGQSIVAEEFALEFQQLDYTSRFESDIIANSRIIFNSMDQFDICKNLKLFINTIINELNQKYDSFKDIVKRISGDEAFRFKPDRKIKQNVSRYFDNNLNTGVFEIKERPILRIMTKWLQNLEQLIQNPQKQLKPHHQIKVINDNKLKQSERPYRKCTAKQAKSFLSKELFQDIKQFKNEYNKLKKTLTTNLISYKFQLLKNIQFAVQEQYLSEQNKTRKIKFCNDMNSQINWVFEYQIVFMIKGLIQICHKHKVDNQTFSLLKFKINDLLRCQVVGNVKGVRNSFRNIKKLEQEGLIKIIKIKNRLLPPKEPSKKHKLLSDIMVFFKPIDSFIVCQCQLILTQNFQQLHPHQKNTSEMNHFLYELQRGYYGAFPQVYCFLKAKGDSLYKNQERLNLDISRVTQIRECLEKHACTQTSRTYPFQCSACLKYEQNIYRQVKVFKCDVCMIIICSQCQHQILTKSKLTYLDIKQQKAKYLLIELDMQREIQCQTQQVNLSAQIKIASIFSPIQRQLVKNLLSSPNTVRISSLMQYLRQRYSTQISHRWKVYFVKYRGIKRRYHFSLYEYDYILDKITNFYERKQIYLKDDHMNFNQNEEILLFKDMRRRKLPLWQVESFLSIYKECYCMFAKQKKKGFEDKIKALNQECHIYYQSFELQKNDKIYYLLIDAVAVNDLSLDQQKLINHTKKIKQIQTHLLSDSKTQINLSSKSISTVILNQLLTQTNSVNQQYTQIKEQPSTDAQIGHKTMGDIMRTLIEEQDTLGMNVVPWNGKEFFKNITVINLQHNYLKNVNTLLASIPFIKSLKLSYNLLQQISFTQTLLHLINFDCSFNSIASLQRLQNVPSLQQLSVSNNNLGSFLLSDNENLATLNLSLNPIKTIKIPSKNNIKVLNLDGTGLTDKQLQTIFQNSLASLSHISLNHNNLNVIPSVSHFPCLMSLSLTFNPIDYTNQFCVVKLFELVSNFQKKPCFAVYLPILLNKFYQKPQIAKVLYSLATQFIKEQLYYSFYKQQQKYQIFEENSAQQNNTIDNQEKLYQQNQPRTQSLEISRRNCQFQLPKLLKSTSNVVQVNNYHEETNSEVSKSIHLLYLMFYFLSEKQINSRHRHCGNSYLLDHSCIPITMSDFVNFSWHHLYKLDLSFCYIKDEQWQQLVCNSYKFSQLRQVSLQGNHITSVQRHEIERFSKVAVIYFFKNHIGNPLQSQSYEMIEDLNRQTMNIEKQVIKTQQSQIQVQKLSRYTIITETGHVKKFVVSSYFTQFLYIHKIGSSQMNLEQRLCESKK